MSCFIDAGAFIAIADEKDPYHVQAVRCLKHLLQTHAPLLTSNFVFDETVTWMRYHLGHKAAKQFGQEFKQAKELTVVTVDSLIEAEAWKIFEKYEDQEFSYTDCTSFVMMKQRHIKTVFCFDKHFQTAGFECIPLERL